MNKILVYLFIAAFSVSLFYAFYSQILPAVDAKAYDAIAWNLAEGFGYRENRNLSYEGDYALGRAGPGYEFFFLEFRWEYPKVFLDVGLPDGDNTRLDQVASNKTLRNVIFEEI